VSKFSTWAFLPNHPEVPDTQLSARNSGLAANQYICAFVHSFVSSSKQSYVFLNSFIRFPMNYNRNMKKVLLPVAYLPALEYFKYLLSADEVLIELHETYPRQSWRNRCSILTAHGILDLIIPVTRPNGKHSKTGDVCICNRENWQKKQWRSIVNAYNKSPFFFYYRDLLHPVFHSKEHVKLWEYNHALLQAVTDELGMKTNIAYTEYYSHHSEDYDDMRKVLTPKIHRRPDFQRIEWPAYQQVFSDRHGFAANLSIIDLLFNKGPDTAEYLENISL
jgi:hypothetical protein